MRQVVQGQEASQGPSAAPGVTASQLPKDTLASEKGRYSCDSSASTPVPCAALRNEHTDSGCGTPRSFDRSRGFVDDFLLAGRVHVRCTPDFAKWIVADAAGEWHVGDELQAALMLLQRRWQTTLSPARAERCLPLL